MGIKITKVEANTNRKNLLGRNVSVKRERQGTAPVSKTRTVTSKNGGVVSTKTSYKDSDSVAGKMRSNKISKINRKEFLNNAKEGAKIGAMKTVKEAAVKKDVMKKLSKNTASVMKRAMREGNEEAKQNIMNGVRKNVERKYPSYKSKP